MTPTISTIEKVRNYQGQNSFVIKMKDTVSRYGGLTPKQLAAVEKCLNAVTTVKVEEMTEEMKRIVDYTGENKFVKEVAGSSVITIVPFGTELISGNTTATLTSSYGSMKIYTNGTNWFALY